MFTLADGVNPVTSGMDAYEKFGFAGLVAFCFLLLLVYHLFATRRCERDLMGLVNRNVVALEQVTAALNAQTKTNDGLKLVVEEQSRQNEKFFAYLKGRDDGPPKGRRGYDNG